MTNRPSRRLRRVEITLLIIGVSLLGAALGETVYRWWYQAEQERALIAAASASEQADVPPAPPVELPAELPGDPKTPPASPAPSAPEILPETKPAAEAPRPRKPAPPSLESLMAVDPELLGRIEIPRVGLSAIVRKGDDDATLRRAVGFIPGTAPPGEGGNTALAGHRDTFFRPLRRVEEGDRIRLVVPPNTYEYRVDSMRVVEPSEVSVLDSSGTEELTLVTCYPFRFIGPAPDRYIVKATRIQ
ncbi:MAG TPA: class D sortase [Thermoanaerobaculia bacterium]|nr:class D sortase [Thermoanaerobaculia bacterium]